MDKAEGNQVFTTEDLLADARGQGTPGTERLIVDWVSKGLLDRPKRVSLGRGRGNAKSTWPEEQRQLFSLLMRKRRGVTRISTLCNIPVALWLYWGPDYVPLRQVRRCLTTWARANRKASLKRGRTTARLVVEQLDPYGRPGPAHKELIEKVASIANIGRVDRKDLSKTLGKLQAAMRYRQQLTPSAAPYPPEAFANVITARLDAIRGLQELPDEVFETARLTYAQSLALSRDTSVVGPLTVAVIIDKPELERRLNTACLDLVTTLGFLMHSTDNTNAMRSEST